jgi:predicted Zn-dependent protease
VRASPEALPTHASLGRAYALAGNAGAAIPHLEKALAGDRDGSLRLQLARAYQAVGQADKAQAMMKEYEALRGQAEADAAGEAAPPPPEGAAAAPDAAPSPTSGPTPTPSPSPS